MALCDSPYHNDFGSIADYTTPPFGNMHSISTPLILPRDWSEAYYFTPTSDPPCDNYEFQSNHLVSPRMRSGIVPSLAGLGIRNVDMDNAEQEKNLEMKYFGGYGPLADDLHQIQPQDRRQSQRTYRTDSIYDVCRNPQQHFTAEDLDQQNDCVPDLSYPWSSSPILKVAEPHTSNAVSELELSTLGGQSSDMSQEDIPRSFERLSAATGLSVADLAAQISATAEVTLKRMAGNSLAFASNNGPRDVLYQRPNDDLATWPPMSKTPDLPLLVVDINMRKLDSAWERNCLGINPADILPASPPPVDALTLDLPFLLKSGEGSNDSVDSLESHALDINRFGFELEPSFIPINPRSPSQPPYTLPLLKIKLQDDHHVSDDDRSVFPSPSSSEYSPSMQPLSLKRSQPSRISAHHTMTHRREVDPDTMSLEYPNDVDQQNLPPIHLGTPVFDAHRGVALEDLKGRAERYRLRNHGRDYDKRWLISFAGKLSERGELIEEFRCYVAGCKQFNKRRDHILIHVGAHLDQRPFKCVHCSSRFLRKNECKRHELSHTGIRPFSCHLCPTATTFVRQDLLKRHMKRTHRLDLKTDKENAEPPRPKKRAKH